MKPNRLKVLRAERDVTQWGLAVSAGIERSRYWTIEKGYVQAKPDERAALATALGVSEADIWPDLADAEAKPQSAA